MYLCFSTQCHTHKYCPQVSCTAAPLDFLGLPQLGHDSTHTNVYMHVGNVVGGGGVRWEITSNATVPFLNTQVFKKLGMKKTLTTPGSHTHPSTYNMYKGLTVPPLAVPQHSTTAAWAHLRALRDTGNTCHGSPDLGEGSSRAHTCTTCPWNDK